jgi:hypothetical protein
MKTLCIFVIAFVAGCAPMRTDYPNPTSPTIANVPVNRCLHFGECDNRPYPRAIYAGGLDPRWAGDDTPSVLSPGFGVDR